MRFFAPYGGRESSGERFATDKDFRLVIIQRSQFASKESELLDHKFAHAHTAPMTWRERQER